MKCCLLNVTGALHSGAHTRSCRSPPRSSQQKQSTFKQAALGGYRKGGTLKLGGGCVLGGVWEELIGGKYVQDALYTCMKLSKSK